MAKRNDNTNNDAAKLEELRDLLLDRYSFGFNLDAQESFLDKVNDLISILDIEVYDENKENYGSFDEFVAYYIDDLFMWESDAIEFIRKQFDDAAEVFDECTMIFNPFSNPAMFAWWVFRHMLYGYIDFEKLEAYVRQQCTQYTLPVD